MKNIPIKIVVLLTGLVMGVNAAGASDLPDCPSDSFVMHDCFGTYTFANGDKYVGEWKDTSRNGQGTYTDASGNKYVGEWWGDKQNGQGTYTFADGSVKEGIWKDDNFLGTVAEVERAERARIAKKEQGKRMRIAKEEKKAQVKREKEDKFDRIYNACLLDKAADVDMTVSSLEKALKVTCESIAKDPSFLEILMYN